jgi:hypothetical protein
VIKTANWFLQLLQQTQVTEQSFHKAKLFKIKSSHVIPCPSGKLNRKVILMKVINAPAVEKEEKKINCQPALKLTKAMSCHIVCYRHCRKHEVNGEYFICQRLQTIFNVEFTVIVCVVLVCAFAYFLFSEGWGIFLFKFVCMRKVEALLL